MQGFEYRVIARPEDGKQHILYSGPNIEEAKRVYIAISTKDTYTRAQIQSRPSGPWKTLIYKDFKKG